MEENKMISQDIATEYDRLYPMLESIFNEMKELSKKKQDGALNKLKVKMVNRILEKIKTLLKDEPTIEFLDLLDEESLPTNSDAVLIISQFEAAMKQFKRKHTTYKSGYYIWDVEEEEDL